MIDPAGFRIFQPNCTFNLTVYRRLNRDELTDEQYMICTPIVLGFCFGVKEWGKRSELIYARSRFAESCCYKAALR